MPDIFYVPILKWRQGEYRAVRDLDPAVVAAMLPLAEIPPVSWDWENDCPAKTLDEHLANIPEQFEKHWAGGRIAVDLPYIEQSDRLAGGVHPLTGLFDGFRQEGVTAIPVIDSAADADYSAAAKAAIARDGHGAMVRVVDDDFADPNFAANLMARVAELGLTPATVDLVIDLGPVHADSETRTVMAGVAQLGRVPHPTAWRTLTLAAGAFPTDLSACAPGSMSEIVRTDWRVWQGVRAQLAGLPRTPLFGDYAVAHPEPSDVDPRIMTRSASIRYTADDKWLVPKGRSVKKHGAVQYQALCQQLVADKRFSGASFSYGDRYIDACATGTASTGNATTWRQVPTNHHLTFVVTQLQKIMRPAGLPPAASTGE